jgi:type I restriction enzyme M protein
MDRTKDTIGYEINFTKYFYNYKPLRGVEELKQDLIQLELETEGLMSKIIQL